MEKTHFKKLRNPNFIGSYELMKGDESIELVVTILKAEKRIIQNGDKKEEAMVIDLKDQKPMIVNSTNAKNISKALNSPYIEDWVNKQITLYVAKIRAFGENVDALRVRDKAPIKILPELTTSHPKWAGALTAMQNGNTTIEAIKKSFTLSPANEKLLCQSSKSDVPQLDL